MTCWHRFVYWSVITCVQRRALCAECKYKNPLGSRPEKWACLRLLPCTRVVSGTVLGLAGGLCRVAFHCSALYDGTAYALTRPHSTHSVCGVELRNTHRSLHKLTLHCCALETRVYYCASAPWHLVVVNHAYSCLLRPKDTSSCWTRRF